VVSPGAHLCCAPLPICEQDKDGSPGAARRDHTFGELARSASHRAAAAILRLLRDGDLIWERADDPRYRTVYNEKLGRPQRIRTAAVTVLEQQGWIQRRPNPQADRLDSGELTPRGERWHQVRARLRSENRNRSGRVLASRPPHIVAFFSGAIDSGKSAFPRGTTGSFGPASPLIDYAKQG
jgi:hypothetical protein